jgi:hypothetical protein
MLLQDNGYDKLQEKYRFWYKQIVMPCTDRQLTKESDRLLAISALALKMKKALLDDCYVAGLWYNDILNGLFWTSSKSTNEMTSKFPAHRTREYRAPSWSWASTEGSVNYYFSEEPRNFLTILDVHCDIKSANPAGEVSGGWLRVSGRTTKASLTAEFLDGSDVPHFALIHQGYDDKLTPCKIYLEALVEGVDVANLIGECTAYRAMLDYSEQQAPFSVTVTCLLVGEHFEGFPRRLTQRYFLILGRARTNPCAYERLGFLFAFVGNEVLHSPACALSVEPQEEDNRLLLTAETSLSRELEQEELLIL